LVLWQARAVLLAWGLVACRACGDRCIASTRPRGLASRSGSSQARNLPSVAIAALGRPFGAGVMGWGGCGCAYWQVRAVLLAWGLVTCRACGDRCIASTRPGGLASRSGSSQA